MKRFSKKTLVCGAVSFLLLTPIAYGNVDQDFVVQSVKNRTHHNAIITGIDRNYHYSGSGDHTSCLYAYSGHIDPQGDYSMITQSPMAVRIDRRNYDITPTGTHGCSTKAKYSQYFIVRPRDGSASYDKACIYAVQDRSTRKYVYAMNITFKSYTDSDGHTYYRPYMQRSNGEWCGYGDNGGTNW